MGRRGIRADKDKVSKRFKELLDVIEARFLEKDFGVADLEVPFSLHSKARQQFAAELGMGVKEYILHGRMTVAAWLLKETSLPIRDIAEFAGFTLASSFTRAFSKWSGGQSPRQYRRSVAPQSHRSARPMQSSEKHWRWILTRREVFSSSWPLDTHRPRTSKKAEADGEDALSLLPGPCESLSAEALYLALRRQPADMQVDLMRNNVRYGTLTFFHLLGKKSIQESRQDRRRGIEVAELAIAWLAILPERFESSRSNLEALAWAWLGNAHRLAEDYRMAESCFLRASSSSSTQDPQTKAEISLYKGTCYLFQRRFREAQPLLDSAVALSRAFEMTDLLTRCLIQRSNLFATQGRYRSSILDLQTAEFYLGRLDDPGRALQVHQTLASSLAFAGDWISASEQLAKARQLGEQHGYPLLYPHLDLVEGIVLQGAGDIDRAAEALEKARLGMATLKARGYAAVASLELAVLRFDQGNYPEAAALASEALPFFSNLAIDRETRVAFRVLRDAILSDSISNKILTEARDQLRRLRSGPQIHIAQAERKAGI
jgi:tetratricopeptide (TPR) repeat protein